MKYKIVMVALAALTAAVVYLYFQNYQLNKQIEELSKAKEDVKITPVTAAPAVTNPASISPFDKPKNDPMANMPAIENNQAYPPTSIKFEKTTYDFGRINEGTVAKTNFKFTNTGKKPLVISNAVGSCGCTVPKWPKQPVKPGETGAIDVEFNSSGKQGENEKTVTVSANTSPTNNILTIKSVVVPKDK